jgi:hypothetical protein
MDQSLETRKHRSRTLSSVEYRSARNVMHMSLPPAANMQWTVTLSARDKLHALSLG